MARATEFEQFIADEIEKNQGTMVPVKASLAERMFVKKARWQQLHPNPDDEFCFPSIGPNYTILSDYAEKFVRQRQADAKIWKDPLVVQKVYPDGYMILNGHHRWGAAIKVNYNPLPISVVNLTQETDIEQMVRKSQHNKRVTLDLDEVVFCEGDEPAEKGLSFPFSRWYKERIRRGVPALLHYLSKQDYDIWVYTAKYYSFEYIRSYFRHYSVRLDGIVTGSARKGWLGEEARKRMEELMRNQYKETLHIDSASVVRTGQIGKRYEVHSVEVSAAEWAQTVMKIVEDITKERDQA